ncbi:MAG: CDP-diacylglycerol--glycerol-3-phosphate 3-phosphatidyltransferase [Clostridia bacterium]|nr:CDP-diacylglycerol--glycerol-3-phosphate 3-phosphatidyltransferase [Clostridia bacterium]
MNLPNRLTISRIVLIVPFAALAMAGVPLCYLFAAILFALASMTDLLDGWYARKHDMVTDFGKLMDPIADKVLVMVALVALLAQGMVSWLAVMVLFAREYIVSGLRLVAAGKGVVIAADKLGKFKTATQMTGIICYLLGGWSEWFTIPGEVLIWISVGLSIVSLVDYAIKNKEVFR